MTDFLFRGSLEVLDADVYALNQFEAERQFRRIILIPSESATPFAVRESLAGPFHNIYAEGYPPEEMRTQSEEEILNYDHQLSRYRRFSDLRYYKGVEYANIAESLARHRAQQAYAANDIPPEALYVNVQALSGGPANNAVYHALVNPGDTVMGMDLIHGGHLSHGSPVNRSGKLHNIVSYTVSPETERIDYEVMRELALFHKPKMIIGGFSSYPWAADWQAFRAIADEVGAYLLADISHVSGLIVAGLYPSPIGIADVVTTTTHKTLCGPRGALIFTHHPELAHKLDMAVFPGEQGGPHVNVFAALATALKLAQTDQFKEMQKQVIKNSIALTNHLEERGFHIPYGGTNTHLSNVDCSTIKGPDGTSLSGDMAARLLDLVGIVVNRNTIPGDRSALNPSGIRIGTPWITQRGFKESHCIRLADIMADVLQAAVPYSLPNTRIADRGTKVDFKTLSSAQKAVASLAEESPIDFKPTNSGYPHFPHREQVPQDIMDWAVLRISGDNALSFLNFAADTQIEILHGVKAPRSLAALFHTPEKTIKAVIGKGKNSGYYIKTSAKDANLLSTWLRDLSDGFVQFDDDLFKTLPGPVSVLNLAHGIGNCPHVPDPDPKQPARPDTKPYFIGQPAPDEVTLTALPKFTFDERPDSIPSKTVLYEAHLKHGAAMIEEDGFYLPSSYTSAQEEFRTVREGAGIFDITHMGIIHASGPEAASFLDAVCANDISGMPVNTSCYTHMLNPEAYVIDDLVIYRTGSESFLLVVNPANLVKDWHWLSAVVAGEVCIDTARPWALCFGRNVILKNLSDPVHASEMLVNIALQGPKSQDILLALQPSPETRRGIKRLSWADLLPGKLSDFEVIISNTGYTGEKIAYELFIHPDKALEFWELLLEVGAEHGLKPIGMAAREMLRIEAGLPRYGHELRGRLNLGVGEAGFGKSVKTDKPWFIGRNAFLARDPKRPGVVCRFKSTQPTGSTISLGSSILNSEEKAIGVVTSTSIIGDHLIGLGFIENKYRKIGSEIKIKTDHSEEPLLIAKIISRFPTF